MKERMSYIANSRAIARAKEAKRRATRVSECFLLTVKYKILFFALLLTQLTIITYPTERRKNLLPKLLGRH